MASQVFIDPAYPEVLADIARVIHEQLMADPRAALEHPVAAEIALACSEHVRRHFGGALIYLPRGNNYELSLRDREIWLDFKGDNYHELMRKYNLTEVRLRTIIAKATAHDKATRQQNLFS